MGRRDAVEIVGFSTAIDRSGFRCGHPALDDWLRTQAGQQERANNTRTFLAIDPSADGVAGYYATTAYRLEPDEAARVGGLGPRRYPVPAVLLARLAVDERHHGRGVGQRLLLHALEGIADASCRVGFEVVIVHAVDLDAVAFYARFGFTRFVGHDRHLFMTTKTLLASFAR